MNVYVQYRRGNDWYLSGRGMVYLKEAYETSDYDLPLNLTEIRSAEKLTSSPPGWPNCNSCCSV